MKKGLTKSQATRKLELAQDKLIDVAEGFGRANATAICNEIVCKLNELRAAIWNSQD